MTDVLTHLAAAYLGVGIYWAVTVATSPEHGEGRLFDALLALLFWPLVIRSRSEVADHET